MKHPVEHFIDTAFLMEIIYLRLIFVILGKLYPGAMLSHGSALEFQPTSAGHIFLTHTYTKRIYLPGMVLRFMEGHAPIEGDHRFSGELFASQTETHFVDHSLVKGTLKRGFDYYRALTHPFSKAVYMMFVVSVTRSSIALQQVAGKGILPFPELISCKKDTDFPNTHAIHILIRISCSE